MRSFQDGFRHNGDIAFIGNYLPRKCGIATFTTDLVTAVAAETRGRRRVSVVAMNDRKKGYRYPGRVKLEIQQDRPFEYKLAADYLNSSSADVVCLQHEFGIFGGVWGDNILALMRRLRKPVVVTCHTVTDTGDPYQKEVFREIAGMADKLIVMCRHAVDLMENVYGTRRSKIEHIPHGVHDVPFVKTKIRKKTFGLTGRVLLTFGLLHRQKGVEYVIDAMPDILKSHPDVTYIVLGATHPHVYSEEGESYRESLAERARKLGVENNVSFINRFVDLPDLLKYLRDTDIFVAPYLDMKQSTSGVLAYAAAAGKAVVATPFIHARELLGGTRGRLVPPRDPGALTAEVVELLSNETAKTALGWSAYAHTRAMTWRETAKAYINVFDGLIEQRQFERNPVFSSARSMNWAGVKEGLFGEP